MVVERTIAIVVVVWATGIFTDPRWRALAYSLPIPITIVLVATGDPVEPAHLVGVLLLVLFFRVAAWLVARRVRPFPLVVAGAVLSWVTGWIAIPWWTF